jgi:FixJ family two-component response regulator
MAVVTAPEDSSMERSRAKAAVLVVDDEVGVRESLRVMLRGHYRVITAPSGITALDLLRDEPIEVVLLDLKMPGLGGIETLGKIREIDEHVEVVIVTGTGSYQSAVDSLRLRAFDYIAKPVDAEHVLAIVERAVKSRRRRREDRGGNRIETVTRLLLELLDALYLERPIGLGERFFIKLDYVRLLAQSLRDGVGGDSAKLVDLVAREVTELERLVPTGGADTVPRALQRVRELVTSLVRAP